MAALSSKLALIQSQDYPSGNSNESPGLVNCDRFNQSTDSIDLLATGELQFQFQSNLFDP